MFEDTKRVVKSRTTKKDSQCNGQMKKGKHWSTQFYTGGGVV